MRVFRINHVVLLAVNEESWVPALLDVAELDVEGVVHEFGTVLFGQLNSEVYYELWCLHVFLRNFKGDHLEGVKR